MDVKFGKIRPNNENIFAAALNNPSDANFFASNYKKEVEPKKEETPASGSRINDYDSNILENNAYQEISDEMFKIEHKIGILEELLSKISSEVDALESLGYEIQISDLKDRKQKIEQELAELNKKYSELGLSAKISGQIASAINFTSGKKLNPLSKIKKNFAKKVLTKISKKFCHSQALKEALENLSNINLSVDELIKMQVPYGETISRYEKLTAYLNKANVIHSQISKNLNAINNAAG
ncbi:MAG: hypothetical protein WCY19_08010 [Candidatus Gastranaerophilaceae bacterium]